MDALQERKRLIVHFKCWMDENIPKADGVSQQVYDIMLQSLIELNAIRLPLVRTRFCCLSKTMPRDPLDRRNLGGKA